MPAEWMGRKAVLPWQAAGVVACVFFHFLIFAQYAFLRRLELVTTPDLWVRPVMLAMGLGGVAGSLWAARRFRLTHHRSWLIGGFAGCGVSAAAGAVCRDPFALAAIGLVVGLCLGVLTVSIAPVLRAFLPEDRIGWWSGWGVGLAYALANLPVIQQASPETQSLTAGVACGLGGLFVLGLPGQGAPVRSLVPERSRAPVCFPGVSGLVAAVFFFLILILLDSAVFYGIQHAGSLREAGWGSALRMWANGGTHLGAALLAGFFLDRGRMPPVLAVALVCLMVGALFMSGAGADPGWPAFGVYLAGVSAYSTGLVAFGPMGAEGKGWRGPLGRAAWVYSIAGWIGSGLGIGMARDLNRVPMTFILVAPLVFAVIWLLAARFSAVSRTGEAR